MKRKLLLLLCATTCSLALLTACGKGTETGSQSNGSSNANMESNEVQDENQKTLSSAFSTDSNVIWYLVDSSGNVAKTLGKDSRPDDYFVFQNGMLTVYQFADEWEPYTLGELSQMSDDEIITALATKVSEKSDYSSQKLEECNQAIAYVEQVSEYSEQIDSRLPEYGVSGTVSNAKDFLEQCKNILESTTTDDGVKTYKLKNFALYTDSTGNNVISEGIAYEYIHSVNPLDSMGLNFTSLNNDISSILSSVKENSIDQGEGIDQLTGILMPLCDSESQSILTETKKNEVIYIKEISSSITNAQVYDAYFGGYKCKDGYLVTRTDENTNFVLDDLDTPNVVIDPKSSDWAE